MTKDFSGKFCVHQKQEAELVVCDTTEASGYTETCPYLSDRSATDFCKKYVNVDNLDEEGKDNGSEETRT